ncbi:MAG: SIMPL domain-containing protein [Pleomorphochaeta sp.]
MKKNKLIIFSLFAISLLFTSCLSSKDINKEQKIISISAIGQVNLTPDIVTFNVEANETKKTTSEALNTTNKKISKVLEILYRYGINDTDISTNSLNLYPQYNWEDGKKLLIGQNASQSLKIKLRDIDKLGKIIDEIGQIENINLYSIKFDKDDKSEAYTKARELAVKNAIEKATTLANAANMTLLTPISISEGSASSYVSYDRVNSKMMMAEASSYSTETPSGELTISTTVNIIFTME